MATSPQVAFRISDPADAALFQQLCTEQDRDRSDMARRVFHAGLQALTAPQAAPAPEPAALAPAARPARSRAGTAVIDHPFTPQPGHALKCAVCGGKRGDHPRA